MEVSNINTWIMIIAADCPSLIVSFPDVSANSPMDAGKILQYTVTSPQMAGPRTRLKQYTHIFNTFFTEGTFSGYFVFQN